jgi:hypothetical protein
VDPFAKNPETGTFKGRNSLLVVDPTDFLRRALLRGSIGSGIVLLEQLRKPQAMLWVVAAGPISS